MYKCDCGREFKIKQHYDMHKPYCKGPKYCQNPECKKLLSHSQQKFCSATCSAKITTKGRKHTIETKKKISLSRGGKGKYHIKLKYCLSCGKRLKTQLKFCDNSCKGKYYRDQKIEKWLNGELDGCSSGGHASYVKYYLLEKYNHKCPKCGWAKINPYTNNIPLEVEHINGNPYCNEPDNVTLLCPNCHSLTATFRGANRGNGRRSYLKKYYYEGNNFHTR